MTSTSHIIRHTSLRLGWPCWLQHCFSSSRHRFKKHASEILVHIDTIASHSCCRSAGFASMIHDPVTPHPKGAVLEWDDSKVIVMFKKPVWDYLTLLCYPAGSRGWVHCGHKGTNMLINNTQSVQRKYPHIMFMPNSDATIWLLQQKWRFIRWGDLVPIFRPFISMSLSFLLLADWSGAHCGLLLLLQHIWVHVYLLCVQRCSSNVCSTFFFT